MCLSVRHCAHQFGRHVGMVVEADVVAVEHPRQCRALERFGVDHDRRIVGPMHAGKHRVELVVAVDEDRFHGACSERLAVAEYDMAKRRMPNEGLATGSECRENFTERSSSCRAAAAGSAAALRRRSRAKARSCVLASSSADNLAAAAKAIAADGLEPLTVAADLRELAGCEQVLARVKERFGRCDILINNAGRTRAGKFLELPDEAFVDGFALKYFAAVRLTRLFWPLLKAAQGHVVNIVGGAARSPEPEFLVGSSVNAAVRQLLQGAVEARHARRHQRQCDPSRQYRNRAPGGAAGAARGRDRQDGRRNCAAAALAKSGHPPGRHRSRTSRRLRCSSARSGRATSRAPRSRSMAAPPSGLLSRKVESGFGRIMLKQKLKS